MQLKQFLIASKGKELPTQNIIDTTYWKLDALLRKDSAAICFSLPSTKVRELMTLCRSFSVTMVRHNQIVSHIPSLDSLVSTGDTAELNSLSETLKGTIQSLLPILSEGSPSKEFDLKIGELRRALDG